MEYQVERVNYHFRRLSEIRRGIASDAGENVEFEAFVFFEVCVHLKDWIASDPRYVLLEHDVHLFIQGARPLRICHDSAIDRSIAISRSPRQGPSVLLGGRSHRLLGQREPSAVSTRCPYRLIKVSGARYLWPTTA